MRRMAYEGDWRPALEHPATRWKHNRHPRLLGRRAVVQGFLAAHCRKVRLIGLAVVFHGWEVVACESV